MTYNTVFVSGVQSNDWYCSVVNNSTVDLRRCDVQSPLQRWENVSFDRSKYLARAPYWLAEDLQTVKAGVSFFSFLPGWDSRQTCLIPQRGAMHCGAHSSTVSAVGVASNRDQLSGEPLRCVSRPEGLWKPRVGCRHILAKVTSRRSRQTALDCSLFILAVCFIFSLSHDSIVSVSWWGLWVFVTTCVWMRS